MRVCKEGSLPMRVANGPSSTAMSSGAAPFDCTDASRMCEISVPWFSASGVDARLISRTFQLATRECVAGVDLPDDLVDRFGVVPIAPTEATWSGAGGRFSCIALQYGDVADENPNAMRIFPDARLSADKIFGRYIEAIGGSTRVNALTSFVATGTYAGFNTSDAWTITFTP